jgi:hypothetical protein
VPPRSLPEQDRRKVLDALRAAVDRSTAAGYVGLDIVAFSSMLEKAPDLRLEVEGAEAAARVANIGAIAKAAKGGNWRAASFLLERTPAPVSRICGFPTNPLNGGTPCRKQKGWGTDHLHSGYCRLHFGNSINGKKHAATERVKTAAELLGLPLGNGDPFDLLTSAVQHAQSQLAGSAALVREAIEAEVGVQSQLDLQAALDFQTETIRSAFRGGKAVVDAKVADHGLVLEDAAFALLKTFLSELLERVPAPARPEIQVWASQRLLELSGSTPVVH